MNSKILFVKFSYIHVYVPSKVRIYTISELGCWRFIKQGWFQNRLNLLNFRTAPCANGEHYLLLEFCLISPVCDTLKGKKCWASLFIVIQEVHMSCQKRIALRPDWSGFCQCSAASAPLQYWLEKKKIQCTWVPLHADSQLYYQAQHTFPSLYLICASLFSLFSHVKGVMCAVPKIDHKEARKEGWCYSENIKTTLMQRPCSAPPARLKMLFNAKSLDLHLSTGGTSSNRKLRCEFRDRFSKC